MKLNLRKANAIQASINEALKNLDLDYSVTLNEFEDVKDQIQTVRDKFWKNIALRNSLLVVLYDIRASVAAANASSGINDNLAKIAYLEKKITFNNMLSSKGSQTALRVLNGKLKKVLENSDTAYGYRAEIISTSIFTEEEVETFRKTAANLKREKQKLQDELLELNIKTTIDLDEDAVEVLSAVDIV